MNKFYIPIIIIIIGLAIFLSFKIPPLIAEIELEKARSEAQRMSDYVYENLELPSGCSYVGDTRYISCLDMSITAYDTKP